ncbi:MAG: SCO family protein [Phycisphaerae bacterium]|nr:SCO family protein [Gemmatimonadaceae bacterium]
MRFCDTILNSFSQRVTRAAVTGALVIGAACERTPEWRGTPVLPPRTVAATAFVDSTGQRVELLPPAGHAALVFFGYTNCPDVCPTTLADWVRVKQAMADDASRVHFVLVTVDPARDTPAVTQRFAAQFDPTFVGLSASPEQTLAVQSAFGANAVQQDSHAGADHVTAHSAQSFLVDDRGNILVAYRFGAGWDVMSADLKTLLKP